MADREASEDREAAAAHGLAARNVQELLQFLETWTSAFDARMQTVLRRQQDLLDAHRVEIAKLTDHSMRHEQAIARLIKVTIEGNGKPSHAEELQRLTNGQQAITANIARTEQVLNNLVTQVQDLVLHGSMHVREVRSQLQAHIKDSESDERELRQNRWQLWLVLVAAAISSVLSIADNLMR